MANPNGQVKKFRPQTAIIRIIEQPNGKFNASLEFEPSIKEKVKAPLGGKVVRVIPTKENNIAVRVAWFVWNKLKEQQKDHIIITDEGS